MKTAIVFLVLLATVYCHPVKRSASSSESSEEVVRPYRLRVKAAPLLHKAAPEQTLAVGSDESSDSSDEAQQSDTASQDSVDTEENESESDESEETTEPTAEPPVIFETTPAPVTDSGPFTDSGPVTDSGPFTDSGRGDNFGYPSNYKKDTIYFESNKIEKGSSPYKYYGTDKAAESMGLVSKKASVYDSKGGNNIEKNLKVYKALQVQDEDDDASTPEVESQGLDSAAGTAYELPTIRQAELEPEAATAESQGTEGEEEQESLSDSASASEEEEGEESQSSQSSEETTATPGAADSSDSSQSSESRESDYSMPPVMVVTAK